MPVYEYKCEPCDSKYIETRGITQDQQLTNCPKCDTILKRIFSTPVVTFNGPGFYKTDK